MGPTTHVVSLTLRFVPCQMISPFLEVWREVVKDFYYEEKFLPRG